MLAHNEYVYGDADATFIDGNDKLLLTTEVKTSSSLPHSRHASRGMCSAKTK
jgi:hypothetical protein